jgi:Na+/melibiose symporter-like transporter
LLQLHLLYFATQIMRLPPAWAGAAIAIAIVWDGISDPLMGLILDRTQTKRGRYSPYLLSGSLLLGLSVCLLFNPAQFATPVGGVLYLAGAYLFVNTAMTIFAVPHIAMGGHLSSDRHERTELYGWRLIFGTVGLLFGLLLPVVLARLNGLDFDETVGRGIVLGQSALVFGLLMVATGIVTTLSVRKYDVGFRPPTEKISLRLMVKEFGRALGNRVFLPLFGAFIAVSVARAINAATAFYYYEFTLQLSSETVVTMVLLPFVFSIMISIPAWVWVSRKFGKKRPAFWGLATLGGLIAVSYPFFPPGQLMGPIFLAVVGGAAVGAVVLFESLVADVTDHEELKSGNNKEGFYFGVWKMGTKLARAAAIGLSGLLLAWIGFDPEAADQLPQVAVRLSWVFGPGVGSLFLLGAFVFLLFPLTDARHTRVQELLARRRQMRDARATPAMDQAKLGD